MRQCQTSSGCSETRDGANSDILCGSQRRRTLASEAEWPDGTIKQVYKFKAGLGSFELGKNQFAAWVAERVIVPASHKAATITLIRDPAGAAGAPRARTREEVLFRRRRSQH